MENEHIKHANCDGGIGKIEDGSEEDEVSVGAEEEVGQPGGVLAGYVDDGEIEHVDHLSVQPSGITAAVREECGDLGVGALAENAPIKHAVDDVAHRACRDKGDAEQHTKFGVFFRETDQNPKQGDNSNNPKEAQRQL